MTAKRRVGFRRFSFALYVHRLFPTTRIVRHGSKRIRTARRTISRANYDKHRPRPTTVRACTAVFGAARPRELPRRNDGSIDSSVARMCIVYALSANNVRDDILGNATYESRDGWPGLLRFVFVRFNGRKFGVRHFYIEIKAPYSVGRYLTRCSR